MNTAITVNLSGIVFHIEENAYEVLKSYINAIKSRFRFTQGADEIIADIESRIAEMFQQRIHSGKQVITSADVNEVLGIMGRPEEFDADSSAGTEWEPIPEHSLKRRLFRDPDEKMLGGVCSGISSYLNIDPVWIRLAFMLAFFIWGSGVLLYLILWIIIPKARTTAEKLQMRGEPVNIDTIERSIRDEMNKVKSHFHNIRSNAKNWNTRDYVQGAKGFAGRLLDLIVQVAGVFFEVIYKIVAVVFVIIGFFILFLLFLIVFGKSSVAGNGWDFMSLSDILFDSTFQRNLMGTGLLLFIGIPFFLILYKGFRMLSGKDRTNRIPAAVPLGLWLLGLLVLFYTAWQLRMDFHYRAGIKKEVESFSLPGNTLYIQGLDTSGTPFVAYINAAKITGSINNGKINGGVKLDIRQAPNELFSVTEVFSGRGASVSQAEENAQRISYGFSRHDSVLTVNTHFALAPRSHYRAQGVRLIVYVPKGKSVALAGNTGAILGNIKNRNEFEGDEMSDHQWLMTNQGLVCKDCEEWDSYDYRRKEHQHHSKSDEDNDDDDTQ